MQKQDPSHRAVLHRFSKRRRVNRRILRFSVSMGAFGLVLTIFVYAVFFFPQLRRAKTNNQRTLDEVRCGDSGCDVSGYNADMEETPDYIIDAQTRYVVEAPPSSNETPHRFPRLEFLDLEFIKGFHKPLSYATLDFEVWRLYLRPGTLKQRPVEVFVGHLEKAPSKMIDTPRSELHVVDSKLKQQADMLADSLRINGTVGNASKLSVDGFEVVYADTNEVWQRGPWVPSFLRPGTDVPTSSTRVYLDGLEVYVARIDASGRLVAISVIQLGSVIWFMSIASLALSALSTAARWLARRFLRDYFVIPDVRVPHLSAALQSGENQHVEFKRGLSTEEPRSERIDSELLKSVAAFANTNDGVIFVGVDDHGAVKGLQLDYKGRDTFEQRIRVLVRNHIKPTPPFQVAFEEVRDLFVAKITVARGIAPAYFLHGVIYIRDGSSDVQAEDLSSLIAEYGF